MSKKHADIDHSAALLLVVAHAVERMTRIGVGKEMHQEIADAIAAVEDADGK